MLADPMTATSHSLRLPLENKSILFLYKSLGSTIRPTEDARKPTQPSRHFHHYKTGQPTLELSPILGKTGRTFQSL
jgi:hypothetical protein